MISYFIFLKNAIGQVTRYNDIFLACAVVMVISLMIIPVPTQVLDALIAVNLSVGVLLLITSMYVTNVLSFSTFPSILLFTTLYRLALDITATRLILIQANAGEIIQAFGNFVVAGNFIVGVVIFLIITIVQFVVITKGAERVSEVGARFTLDAMPGKQMSIDADMRAGVIDINQARTRRSLLEKESQLYGAMDGAMKFVKGDAIASLIITAINILAGLAIGIGQKGMPLDKALTTYSILTIGDGLVSQIPSLLISITAAILVTRVSSEETGGGLGGEIGLQLMGQPRALIIVGFMLLVAGMIPGFPTPLFWILGVVVGVVGYTLSSKEKKAATAGALKAEVGMPAATRKTTEKPPPDAQDEFSVSVPLILDIASDLEPLLPQNEVSQTLAQLRSALYHDLGVPFPGIRLRMTDRLPKGTYRIMLNEVPVSSGRMNPGSLLIREKPANLRMLGIEITEDKPFLPNVPTVWASTSYRDQLVKAGIPFFDPPQILIYHVAFVLKRYAGDFIGLQETSFLLTHLEEQMPAVVKEVQRALTIQKIAEILSRLVREEISIRDLRAILEALVEWSQREKEVVLLTDYVRTSMKRYISYKFSGGQNILGVYLFEPSVEETLRKAVRQTSAGSYLALPPPTARKLMDAIKKEVGDVSQAKTRPILLTSMDIRRYLRKFVEPELYEVPVLSYQELTEEITVQPLGRINI